MHSCDIYKCTFKCKCTVRNYFLARIGEFKIPQTSFREDGDSGHLDVSLLATQWCLCSTAMQAAPKTFHIGQHNILKTFLVNIFVVVYCQSSKLLFFSFCTCCRNCLTKLACFGNKWRRDFNLSVEIFKTFYGSLRTCSTKSKESVDCAELYSTPLHLVTKRS